MGKLEMKKQKKKDALFNTAFELFTTKGTNQTTISDIVNKAGVAKGTFYLYFKDKYDVRNKLISHKTGELFYHAHEALARTDICDFEEQVHFIVAADNPVAGCSWKLSEISQNEFVLTEQAMSYRKILNETLASQSLEIRPVLEIGNPLQICELVKNSSLLSFLPDFISEKYVKDGQIKRLDVAGCPVTVWTQLLLHKNKWRSPAINVFIEFYKEVMQR